MDGRGGWFRTGGPPLKFQGIFDFFPQFARRRHSAIALVAINRGKATADREDSLTPPHSALADNRGLLIVVEHVTINIDAEFLFESTLVGRRAGLPPHRAMQPYERFPRRRSGGNISARSRPPIFPAFLFSYP